MSRRIALASLTAVALAACGARSALYDQVRGDGAVPTTDTPVVVTDARPMDSGRDAALDTMSTDVVPTLHVECPRPVTAIESVSTPLVASVSTSAMQTVRSQWTVLLSPSGANAVPMPDSSPTTQIAFDRAGDWQLRFTASDAFGNTESCTTSARVAPATVTAVCPATVSARQTETASLAGGGISNANRPLTYAWTVLSHPDGATATPSPADAARSSVTFDQGGDYAFGLTVSDDLGHIGTCRMRAEVQPAIELRCANDQSGYQGATIDLTSTATSNFGRMLSFQWQVVSRPAASTSAPTPANSLVSGLVLDQLGDWRLQLVATDTAGLTSRCTTIVHADPDVIVQCPSDITTRPFATEQLTGTASSRLGRPLTYRWSVVEAPVTSTAAIANGTTNPTPYTFDVAGNWTFRFTASNDLGNAAFCSVHARAVSDEAVRVELVWSTSGVDLDLHLADATRAQGRWAMNAPDDSDCYYANCKCNAPPDGGLCPDGVLQFPPDGIANNPQLDIDHVNDLPGPENINVNVAAAGSTFDVGVHFYGTGTTNATVRVYCSGTVVFESEAVPLTGGRGGPGMHDLWRVGRITTTAGGCSFRRCGTPGALTACILPEDQTGTP